MPENYAQALLELSRGVTGDRLDVIIRQFIEILQRKHHTRLLPAIVHRLGRKLTQADRDSTVWLTVAKASDAAKYEGVIGDHAQELGGLSDKKISVRTDEKLLGGYVIQTSNTRINNSQRKHLLDLYTHLTSLAPNA